MKLTKSKLKQIIKEELNEIEDYSPYPPLDDLAAQRPQEEGGGLSPEQQKVISLIEDLVTAVYAMGESNPTMSDEYIQLFRALNAAGVNTTTVAMMA